jgi:hypothetical protein
VTRCSEPSSLGIAAVSQPDGPLLSPNQLAKSALGPHADLGGVNLKVPVLRLPGIGAHRLGLIADPSDLIDRLCLCNCTAGGIVSGESGHAKAAWHERQERERRCKTWRFRANARAGKSANFLPTKRYLLLKKI